MNLFNAPLWYIAFKRNEKLELQLREYGFKNINHFPAVNGKALDPDVLLRSRKLSLRAHWDLKFGRDQHQGIPTMGGIGCALSHYSLWELCIRQRHPYMIICEEDVLIERMNAKQVHSIENHMSQDTSIFVTVQVDHSEEIKFFGMQLYFISLSACVELLNDAYPIDVQVDSYISYKSHLGHISLKGARMTKQSSHASSIQDTCVPCVTSYAYKKGKRTASLSTSVLYLIFIGVILVLLYTRNIKKTRVK